ncbi:MAG: SixA phosphatase family protein [Solirubrobacteraceae bacterium]
MPEAKRLFLLRHAKSSWDDPGLDDHERPLAPRGRRAVMVLGEHLRDKGIRPVQVLCSSSRRTRETLEGVAPGGETLIEAELYQADPEQLLERLRRVSEDVESVMVIGHNPTLQITALRLSDAGESNGDGSHRAQISQKFPTGALATLSFDCRWSELGPGCARVVDYIRPKAIAQRSPNAPAPE